MFCRISALLATKYRWLIVLVMMSVSYSCGFQLRGALDITADIAPVYIDRGDAFELAREIESLLERNRITLATDSAAAGSQLILVNEHEGRRVLSVDSSGRASEYLLTYTVNIKVKIRQAKETMDAVSLSRSLVFDPNAVLAVTNEAELLYRDMRKDAARLVLMKLQARSTHEFTADDSKRAGDSAVKKTDSTPDAVTGNGQ